MKELTMIKLGEDEYEKRHVKGIGDIIKYKGLTLTNLNKSFDYDGNKTGILISLNDKCYYIKDTNKVQHIHKKDDKVYIIQSYCNSLYCSIIHEDNISHSFTLDMECSFKNKTCFSIDNDNIIVCTVDDAYANILKIKYVIEIEKEEYYKATAKHKIFFESLAQGKIKDKNGNYLRYDGSGEFYII